MNKAGILSAATLALGAIIAGVYYSSEQVNLETNRAYLEYRGVSKDDGALMQEFITEYDMPSNVTTSSYSFLTYDSSDSSYDPDDSETWTEDIYLGYFNVDVSTNDFKAMEVINQIASDLGETFPQYEIYERKSYGQEAPSE